MKKAVIVENKGCATCSNSYIAIADGPAPTGITVTAV